ncbi:hypothetical protein GX48_08079 [Paracoccidioides brasiliensis]|nr:hypothetical protein GX48_08079 [Paracoccidioides brasiliensis]
MGGRVQQNKCLKNFKEIHIYKIAGEEIEFNGSPNSKIFHSNRSLERIWTARLAILTHSSSAGFKPRYNEATLQAMRHHSTENDFRNERHAVEWALEIVMR